MAKDFLRFLSPPIDLIKALRKVAVGGLIASTGLSANPQAAPKSDANEAAQTSIVDRSRKVAKLILKLPGTAASFVAQHRSHSSHRSHYSSSGGGAVSPKVPAPAPAPPPVRVTPPPVSAPAAAMPALAVPTNTVAGEVVSVDKEKRTFLFKQSETVWKTISYRDDTKYETEAGASIRFDDFADASGGQVPIAKGDKLELGWRMSSDGRMPIAVTVLKRAK